MASTLLFLTDGMSSTSLFRHWSLTILMSTLLMLNNELAVMVLGETTLDIYEFPLADLSKIVKSNSTMFNFTSIQHYESERNALVSIPMHSMAIFTNETALLKIGSANFLVQISIPNNPLKPTLGEAVLYGFLGVTVTNLCALMGMVCIPIQHHRCYRFLLIFMTGLAVGALLSTALLVLIPEAMRMVDMPAEFGGQGRIYLIKMTTIFLGVIFFYILEYMFIKIPKLLKWDSKYSHPNINSSAIDNISTNSLKTNEINDLTTEMSIDKNTVIEKKSCCAFRLPFNKYFIEIAPVAWMILLGDSFHNLMDGLTIGAGFSQSPTVGIALSLSILFEELPHELGDFAILLMSGMSIRAALLANFLSACSAYLGLIIGLIIGEVPSGALYVFAVTAGIFLYISLSDMLPTMRKSIEDCELNSGSSFNIFLIQVAGLLLGYTCVVTVTIVTDFISL